MSEPLSESLPEEQSFFDFKCPYCRDLNSFPVSAAGTLQECAACLESIIVPKAGGEEGGKLPFPIRAPRLLLRRLHPEDSLKLLKMVEEDETSTVPISETTVDQFVEVQRATRFTRAESGIYLAVELAEAEELAGYLQIWYLSAQHFDVGFRLTIAPARRRQGLGLEAVRAAVDFAFDGLCARRVSVTCFAPDTAARALLVKAGLRQEGEFIQAGFDGKEWVNVLYYALLKTERVING